MKPTFIRRLLAHYPNWHDQPFRLSVSEIKDPYLVLDEFFERYDLGNIRIQLKEMITDALNDSLNDDPVRYIGLCDNLEKLAEACFVLYRNQNETYKASDEDDHAKVKEADESEKIPDDITEEQEKRVRFTKPISPIEMIKKDLPKGVYQIFRIIDPHRIDKNLTNWFNMAIGTASQNYEQASQRADLLVYIGQLRRLYEALYAIKEIEKIKELAGRDYLSPGLRGELHKDGNFKHLSEEEIDNPVRILKEFFSLFTYRYAHLELRDLLDAAITYKDENPRSYGKANLLLEYDCMSALLYAAWLLPKNPDEPE
jgi:hypothetical protein